MRLVGDYNKHAEECRKLATQAISPGDKRILEKMAQSWEILARIRKNDLAPKTAAQAEEVCGR